MKRMALFISLLLAGCGLSFRTGMIGWIMTGSGHWLSYSITGDWQRGSGDTVDLHAYFAGEEVNRIQWTISTTVLLGSFGVDTYYDVISLQSLVAWKLHGV